MRFHPAKVTKWELSEQYQFNTTQSLAPYFSHANVNQSKSNVKKLRYNIPQKSQLNPRQKLIILPTTVQKEQNEAYSARNEISKAKVQDRAESLPKLDGREENESESKHSRIHNKDYKPVKNKVFNHLKSKETVDQSKSPPLHQALKKLDPIPNQKKTIKNQQITMNDNDNSWTLLKNALGTKQVFHIKKRMNNSKPRITFNQQEDKYYRLGEEQGLQNVFNIHSIDTTPMNYLPEKTSPSLLRQYRRSTQPNIQTQESCNSKSKKEQSLLTYLQVRTIEQRNSLVSHEPLKQKESKFRLKQIIPVQNRKVIKLKTKKFIQPFSTFFYRNFLWKVNWTNSQYTQPPLEYEHRLKVFIARGNNSCMIRGLISRRHWFAFTDRMQEANFLWTQLKELNYFKVQKSSQILPKKHEKQEEYLENSYLLESDVNKFQNYWQKFMKLEQNGDQRLLSRQRYFKYSTVIKADELKNSRMHNHLKNNYVIGNKKALLKTMCNYYGHINVNPFEFMPLTFHISDGLEDENFLIFQRFYHKRNKEIRRTGENKKNIWIVKPGENSNRGFGIKVCNDLQEVKSIIKNKEKWADGSNKTYIIQSYIQDPLLYKKRKIDIRHYIVITCINGHRKGYWYADGCIRTASAEYKLSNGSQSIHLTNDAIQKYLPDYGKYQKGNKLSYEQLDSYIKRHYQGKSFYGDIYPQMKKMAIDIMKASINYLDPDRLENNFEIFGLDFMIDNDLKLWLIEVNSNPCLELSCPLLAQIIPNLVENVLQVTLDVLYPPPIRYCPKIPRYLSSLQEANRLELVFDERVEDGLSGDTTILDNRMLVEEDDVFENDGSDWQQN